MASADDRGGTSKSDSPTGLYTPSERPTPVQAPSPAPAFRPSRLDLTIPPPQMPVISRFAGYDVIGRLAVGGMAEILLARRPTAGGSYVVIKRILDHFRNDERFLGMFLDEARLGAQLHHTNICQMYDCGKADGAHYIVMEWVNGATLGRVVKHAAAKGGIPLRVGLRIIADLARGLDYAHNAKDEQGEPLNLIHRDVTPHNIMISFHGEVKLLDFGIAKAEEQLHHTQTGVVKGKFAYMAPEQSMNHEVDHRADIFSLGLCLYELLAGRSAYKRGNAASTISAVVTEPLPPLPEGLPDPDGNLIRIVQVAAAKERDDRFETAAQFADAIERYAQSIGGLATEREVSKLLRKLFAREFAEGPEIEIAGLESSGTAKSPLPREANTLETNPADDGPTGMRELELDDDDASYQDISSLLSEPPLPSLTQQRRAPAAAVPAIATPKRRRPRGLNKAVGLFLIAALSIGVVAAAMHHQLKTRPPVEEKPVSVTDNPLLVDQGAQILVASSPAGADVHLDGKHVGKTPTSIVGLKAGGYDLRVKAPGFAEWSETVAVGLGRTLALTARLVPGSGGEAGIWGSLDILADVPATVFVNGDRLGKTPLYGAKLPAGKVLLEFRLESGSHRIRQVVIEPGEKRVKDFSLRSR